MKIIQLNIWQGRLLRGQTLKYLKQANADILCLQEVYSCSDHVRNLELFDSLEQIKEVTGLTNVFFSPVVGFDIQGAKVEMGNAILSRFPLKNMETIFTHGEYKHLDVHTEITGNNRNALICSVDTPTGTLSLSSHHGYWDTDSKGTPQTTASMKIWIDALKKRPTPLIACGDLNVVPQSEAMRQFENFLENLTDTYKIDTTLSVLGIVNDIPCDHILVSEDVVIHDFFVEDELVSDHKALVLECSI